MHRAMGLVAQAHAERRLHERMSGFLPDSAEAWPAVGTAVTQAAHTQQEQVVLHT